MACGSKKDAYESIKENKKLVVAVSPDYAPFEFKTLVDGKDQVVGSDIKLAQAIADELGVKLEVTTMSFDNVLSSLQSGKADLAISGISVTAARRAIAPRNSFFIRNSCINIIFARLFYLKLVVLSTFIKKLRQFF